MPSFETICAWRNIDQSFSEQLSRARKDQAVAWADSLVQIADECPETNEAVNKARLKVHVRQFLIPKYNKEYVEERNKTEVNVSTAVVLLDLKKQEQLQERRKTAELTLKDKQ